MRQISYAEALREGMRQSMQQDDRVFLIGEDIGVYGGAFGVTAGLIDEFEPDRVIDTPISEAGIAVACTEAAAQHSESLESWFVNVPGLKVVMSATPYDAKGLLVAAIEDKTRCFSSSISSCTKPRARYRKRCTRCRSARVRSPAAAGI